MKEIIFVLLVSLSIAIRIQNMETTTASARQMDYSALANALLNATNNVRAKPGQVATVLQGQIQYFDGTVLYLPTSAIGIGTKEGAAVWKEAIKYLQVNVSTMYPMVWEPKLVNSARDHVLDLAAHNMTGHIGSNGSNPADRIGRYGNINSSAAENIACGSEDAASVLNQLIVDDDFPSRGHRYAVYANYLFLMGAYCGPHPTFRTCCVINYVDAWYVETPDAPAPAAAADTTTATTTS
jgi:uncharacterized protein YkwD